MGRVRVLIATALVGAALAGPAWAQSRPQPAPRADRASGVVVPDDNPSRDSLRWVPRVLLFVPRWTAWALAQPVRGAAWAWDRYDLDAHTGGVLLATGGPFGLFPVVEVESGFGAGAGVRAIGRDLFGEDEAATARARFGGRVTQGYQLAADTGTRFDPARLELAAAFDDRPAERFFGLGNGAVAAAPPMPVDALAGDLAAATRYRRRGGSASVGVGLGLAAAVDARLSTGLIVGRYDDPNDVDRDVPITSVYQPSSLVGFDRGETTSYSELAVTFDDRQRPDTLSEALFSTGWRLAGWAGVGRGLGRDRARYLRYGLWLERTLDLYGGTRVLWLRARGEALAGRLDRLPFAQLPALGGAQLLRGYATDRFRDRAAAVATAEYRFELLDRASAFLFADAGRVWASVGDATLRGLRVGYGGGVELYGHHSFLARLELATSIDGGLFVALTLDPAGDPRARAR